MIKKTIGNNRKNIRAGIEAGAKTIKTTTNIIIIIGKAKPTKIVNCLPYLEANFNMT
jgi:hypothetical protein